jgi:hypothetical protein
MSMTFDMGFVNLLLPFDLISSSNATIWRPSSRALSLCFLASRRPSLARALTVSSSLSPGSLLLSRAAVLRPVRGRFITPLVSLISQSESNWESRAATWLLADIEACFGTRRLAGVPLDPLSLVPRETLVLDA